MINVRWEQGNIHLRSCFRRSNWQRTLTRLRGIFQSYLAFILQFWLLFYCVLKEASFKCSRHWWERSRECSTLRWVHRGRVFLSQVFYIQGGFFYCSALKMTKCQPDREIWELFLPKKRLRMKKVKVPELFRTVPLPKMTKEKVQVT